ncbi:hypothetical protein GW17_00029505 [Ensete ventricosum]|nr:hypothetical protein GW17_00029505 [Ensete ventricosum]
MKSAETPWHAWLQGSLLGSRRNPVPAAGERVLAAGLRDERGRRRRRRQDVGEGKQHGVDQHEPQLGGFLPGLLETGRPTPFLQDHVLHHEKYHHRVRRRSFELERGVAETRSRKEGGKRRICFPFPRTLYGTTKVTIDTRRDLRRGREAAHLVVVLSTRRRSEAAEPKRIAKLWGTAGEQMVCICTNRGGGRDTKKRFSRLTTTRRPFAPIGEFALEIVMTPRSPQSQSASSSSSKPHSMDDAPAEELSATFNPLNKRRREEAQLRAERVW